MGQSCCAQPLEEDVALELSAVDHRTVLTGTEQSYASSTLLDASRRSGGLDHVPGRCKEVPTLLADPQCHLAIATAAQDPKDSGRTASAKLKTRLLQEAEQLIDEGLDEWLRSWCTDEVLCTFLGASSKESAVASLATALKWRRRYKDILTGSRAPCWQGDMRVVARGAAGHPVIFMSMQHQPPKSSSMDTSEHMAAVLEAAVSAAHAGAWGFDVVCDCRGFQLSKNLNPRPAVSAMEMLKHAYRGRMRFAFLVGAPVAFGGFWKLVKGLLPKPTQEKIRFIALHEAHEVLRESCGIAAAGTITRLLASDQDATAWRFPSELAD